MAMEATPFKCPMCVHVSATEERSVNHVVREHRHDKIFRVQCLHEGCGATFDKWRVYKLHVKTHVNQPGAHADDEVPPNNDDFGDIHIDVEEGGLPVYSKDWLQKRGAEFLVTLRERCKLSQSALQEVIEGVEALLEDYSMVVMDIFAGDGANVVDKEEIRDVFQRVLPPSEIFSEVNTKHKLDTFLVEKCGMIIPSKELLGSDYKVVYKPKCDVVLEDHFLYYIPMLEKLKRLLEIEAIREMIDLPRNPDGNFLTTVLDGSDLQTNDFFKDNLNALALILYYDDLGISCPLGASATSQKLSVFYWTLENILPEIRSNLNMIFLLGIVKTKFLKKYGLRAVLKPFIKDISYLQSTGVEVIVNGESKTYKGSLCLFSGDTPAAGMVSGCKESVAASKPCRTCMTDHEHMFTCFEESLFQLTIRTKELHAEHLRILADPTLSSQELKLWRKCYGVNSASPLLEIPHCDVTKCCVQDAMHIILEGVLEVEIRLFVLHCTSNAVFTLSKLNDTMDRFNYGYFRNDRPAAITPLHLRNGLKQSAAQMLTLCFCLPFLIYEWMNDIDDDTEERLVCFIKLAQIVNLTLAYKMRIEDTVSLSKMIESHHRLFAELYPGKMTPKFHFLIHIPRQICEFGPARQTWCMRFEAAHAPKKSLVSVVKNFKNMPITLAYRSESLSCVNLKTSSLFLYKGDKVSPGPTVYVQDLPFQEKICDIFEIPEGSKLMKTNRFVCKGTSYGINDVILRNGNNNLNNDELPSFAKIQDIYVYKEKKILCFSPVKTMGFDEMLNAYKIMPLVPSEVDFILVQDIEFPHSLPVFDFKNCQYVVLLYHWKSEFYG